MIPTVQARTFIVWMDIAKDVYRVRSLIEKNLPAVVLKSQKTAAHVFLGRPPSLSISIYYRKNIDGRRHYKKTIFDYRTEKEDLTGGRKSDYCKTIAGESVNYSSYATSEPFVDWSYLALSAVCVFIAITAIVAVSIRRGIIPLPTGMCF
jgi:hypothetical protein